MRWLDDLKRRADDRGIALPFVAIILVLLLGMAAFAVDLGWIFLNGARVQRAADSAALAGVVYLPGDTPNVSAFSINGAQANGYDIGTLQAGPNPPAPTGSGGPDTLAWQAVADNKLEVTLDSSIETFFLKVFGFQNFDIKRISTAEYIKPVPLGSPGNCIGIGQSVTSTGLPPGASSAMSLCNTFAQNFWAAINGKRTDRYHGDPYAVTCGFNCSGPNPTPLDGYYHGIEVPTGKTFLDVYVYDGGFYDRVNFAEAGDEENLSNTTPGGTHTTFSLWNPDSTPLIPDDKLQGQPSCGPGSNTTIIDSEDNTLGYKNEWRLLCRVSPVTPGIYVLHTQNGGNIGGNNDYSFLVNTDSVTSSPIPRVYAINSMSIFTNAPGGQATVYVADVHPDHAGKTLELNFYDPGESSGDAWMEVTSPPGVVIGPNDCPWTATNGNFGTNCRIQTTSGGSALYNGEWINMQIKLPGSTSYNCNPLVDCFWKMDVDLNVSHDRTTWEAKIIGNPVKLDPNQ